jgi:hypothetical protein
VLSEGNLVNPATKQKDVTVTKKYAHISYEKPTKNGLYQEAYARVGTLQQITEEVALTTVASFVDGANMVYY